MKGAGGMEGLEWWCSDPHGPDRSFGEVCAREGLAWRGAVAGPSSQPRSAQGGDGL